MKTVLKGPGGHPRRVRVDYKDGTAIDFEAHRIAVIAPKEGTRAGQGWFSGDAPGLIETVSHVLTMAATWQILDVALDRAMVKNPEVAHQLTFWIERRIR